MGLISCARAPLKEARDALHEVSAPDLADDLPLEGLVQAIETEIAHFEKSPNQQLFVFGERTYPKADYLAGLRRFVELSRTAPDKPAFLKLVREHFDFFEVYGDKSPGEVFITSYYEPVVPGSLKKTEKHSRPLYKAPDDLVGLDLAAFDAQKYRLDRKLRGRVVGKKLVPYFSREDIDVKDALKGRGLELVWVDPLDSFMIQIQGSATIDLGHGKQMRVGYAEKNGHVYEPLGKFIRDKLPPDQLNLLTIEKYMRSLLANEMQAYLNKNPSYVFFQELKDPALTSLGVPATAGRTIAVDARFFPKGALAYLVTTKPKFDSPEAIVPTSSEPLERFVLDQDIGGAITGGGRLDLFWGAGDEAKRMAGVMKQSGRLYYLAPKLAPK